MKNLLAKLPWSLERRNIFSFSMHPSSKVVKSKQRRSRIVYGIYFPGFFSFKLCLTILSGKIKGVVLQQVGDNILYHHKLKYFSEYFRMIRKGVDKVTHWCFNFQGLLCFCCLETTVVVVRTWRFNSRTSHRIECWVGSEETWSTCEKWALLQELQWEVMNPELLGLIVRTSVLFSYELFWGR